MKKHSIYLALIFGVMAVLTITTHAQKPAASPSPAGDGVVTETPDGLGNYNVVSSLEFGYRGIRTAGDVNKYKSDLNYKAGPRIFDSSFLMKSKDGSGGLFDTLLVTSTGFGADPNGNVRISAESAKWYRFDGTYRRFKYYRFLNTFANPNWVFSPANFSVPPKSLTGEHGQNVKMEV